MISKLLAKLQQAFTAQDADSWERACMPVTSDLAWMQWMPCFCKRLRPEQTGWAASLAL
ncbi:hypothetical protein H6G65_01995 [Microcystis elabens FACHB-917]|nr:hypothetical protein [Microcystis elabens FACHB-917]